MKKHLLWIMLLVFFSTLVSAQSGQSFSESLFLPPAPESSSLIRSITHPSVIWCGGADITVPLYQAASRSVGVNMALHYQSSGNKVHDISGSTGLGWRFSAGGRITRIVRGLPSEITPSFGDQGSGGVWSNQVFETWLAGRADTDPVLYFYSLVGRAGDFVVKPQVHAPPRSIKPPVNQKHGDAFRFPHQPGWEYTFGVSAKDVTTAKLNGQNLYAASYTST